MQIIISPAKKMNRDNDWMSARSVPVFLNDAAYLWEEIQRLDPVKQKAMWKCSDKLAKENRQRFEETDLSGDGAPLPAWTPALLAYEGIQYQYMAPKVFSQDQWEYVEKHLNILSGLYGILRPLDGVVPYRLEMQAALPFGSTATLYAYWKDRIWKELDRRIEGDKGRKGVVDLASKEYSKCIRPYIGSDVSYITCTFAQMVSGKPKVRATLAKMARGEMVRFLAEQNAQEPEQMKHFQGLGFSYVDELSRENEYVFICRRSKQD